MSPATIPAIITRIEHWPTSLRNSGSEASSGLSLSRSSSTDLISSVSTELITFSLVRSPVFLADLEIHSLYRPRSEEHTSELQSRQYLVCRLLLEKKKTLVLLERSTHSC